MSHYTIFSIKQSKGAERGNLKEAQIKISLTKAKPGLLSPSIDATMKSVTKIYNGNVVGVILSGMGRDGCEGMKAIKETGGKTVTQDGSSLIFGMPKAVIDAECADKVLPAEKIADTMMELVS